MTTTLTAIVPDQLWEAGHHVKMMPGLWLPTRMTIVKMAQGELALHSPIPIDDALAQSIAELGEVTLILAPNNFHNLFLRKACERYPQAQVWGSPGLPKKKPDLVFTGLLDKGTRPPWSDVLTPFFLDGAPGMSETVFIHRPSKSLIAVDSFFNLRSAKNGFSRFMLKFTSSYGKAAQSRIWRMMVKDRKAMAESTRPLLAEDFDRVVMAHGAVVDQDAKTTFEKAAAWLYK
ncbi:MAG TPA: DUF4336 domain-containing protein [Myxococcota bacterium]|nr:DUF4336 domain-containing protein [Myxococcota bacterium]